MGREDFLQVWLSKAEYVTPTVSQAADIWTFHEIID